MAPPAKRRKRNVVDESSDYEAEGAAPPTPVRKAPNSLHRYLLSSPDAKPSSAPPPEAIAGSPSLSPAGTTARFPAASQPVTRGSGLRTAGGRIAKQPTKSPSTSPEKARKNGKGADEKGRTADLKTLFSKQAEKAVTNGGIKAEFATFDEIISDPISDDDEIGLHRAVGSSLVGRNAQRRAKAGLQNGFSSSSGRTGGGFLQPPRIPAPMDDDQRPWSERFGPNNLEELAVHKKKVADVRTWLEEVMGGRRRQRLLVLKGAAGTGKTTTVKLLAKELRCEILEWRNPAGSLGAIQGYASASAQFDEFMGRSGKFGQLDLESDSPVQAAPVSSEPLQGDTKKLVLIEEFPNTFMRSSSALTSFRSSLLRYLAANTPSLAAFAQPSDEPVTPLVMIISETLLTTTSASADSFTAHRLLGPEILQHPGVQVIEFNTIAPTLMAKALEVIVQKESRKSGRRRTPGPLVLQKLGEIGDIRNAISSLEFLCLKGDEEADWGAKVVLSKPKKGAKAANTTPLTKGEEDSLELISQRESTLGIFHAVGKVVYNKRDETGQVIMSDEAAVEDLPSYMKDFARPKKSLVALDTLMDETGTDTHTFISALHENYLLSCERIGPTDTHSAVDYVNGCIEYLSESDLMCPSWDSFFGGRGFSGSFVRDNGSHIVRQDEIAFQVAVRGILFSLPSPVKRQPPHGGRGGDAFKMFYPASLKLWRPKEELEALIDLWAAKLLKGEATGLLPVVTDSATSASSATAPTAFIKSPKKSVRFDMSRSGSRRPTSASSVGDWPTKNPAMNSTASQLARQASSIKKQEAKEDDKAALPLLALGSAARSEMLLERLPYMAQMARGLRQRGLVNASAGNGPYGPSSWRELDRVVSFQGIDNAGADDEADDEWKDDSTTAVSSDTWSTDRPTDEGPSPRKRRGLGAILRRAEKNSGRGRSGSGAGAGAAEDEVLNGTALSGPVMKLVLSDDDIEDD
jgi:cell cycle checkpoint protein